MKQTGVDGFVVKSYDELAFIRQNLSDMDVILDHNLYTWNSYAKKQFWDRKPVRDTVPLELNRKELEEYLEHRKAACPYKTEKELLIGLFPEKLIRVLCAQKDLIRGITDFRLPVKNGLSFEQAQVCSGGVDTSEVHSKTMESRLHKGLYFAGELLDIDGTCGGYNLQWAWSSGAAAGIWAAKEEEK